MNDPIRTDDACTLTHCLTADGRGWEWTMRGPLDPSGVRPTHRIWTPVDDWDGTAVLPARDLAHWRGFAESYRDPAHRQL